MGTGIQGFIPQLPEMREIAVFGTPQWAMKWPTLARQFNQDKRVTRCPSVFSFLTFVVLVIVGMLAWDKYQKTLARILIVLVALSILVLSGRLGRDSWWNSDLGISCTPGNPTADC